MARTPRMQAIAVAPHALATKAAAAILEENGSAIEAIVAAAAVLSVVYPHMTGLGGDGFWLLREPSGQVWGIDASGPAGALARPRYFHERGVKTMPTRGPLAASTVAGTVAGWDLALDIGRDGGRRFPLSRLLEHAVFYAQQGFPISESQARSTRARLEELSPVPGFGAHYLGPAASVPKAGDVMRQRALATTLEQLARVGLDDFYRGAIADGMASDLAALGAPITRADLSSYHARRVRPLEMAHSLGTLYNLPPPTQGVLSLMILGILDRLALSARPREGADMIHLTVEATKRAFGVRHAHMDAFLRPSGDVASWLREDRLVRHAQSIDPQCAALWTSGLGPADTVWLGAMDRAGYAVSFIQSLYHEFGSGVVLPGTGICWQNRGASFSLHEGAMDEIAPGRRPYHTLNPALAVLHDGRVLAYGAMGGDGQPQTQAALFTRVALYNCTPHEAVAAPRWLLGRTWGNARDDLKLEARFSDEIYATLRSRGHVISLLSAFDEMVGHAGILVRAADGGLSGGADPRSDGAVLVVDAKGRASS